MNCLTCANKQLNRRFELDHYCIVECPKCGVMFNETFFDDEDFRENLFEEGYYNHVQSQAFNNRLDKYQNDPSVKVYSRYLDIIEKNISAGKVLDVGCAFGTFLKVAETRGWQPHGVEVSEYSSQTAAKYWGFEIFNGNLNDCLFEHESFALVTFWDVIEHTKSPKENLKKAYDLLKPNGYILLTTDNYRSLISFITDTLYKVSFKSFKYPVKKFYIPYNTVYFKPSNLKKLLEDVGFETTHFEYLDYPIEKLDVTPAEKVIVRALYFAGSITRSNSQFMVIAQKKNQRETKK